MAGAPVYDFLRICHRTGTFIGEDGTRVMLVFGGCVERETPDRVFDPQKILELKWDEIWRAYEKQVVGNNLGVDIPGRDSLALIPVPRLLSFLVVEFLETALSLI